MNKIEYDIELNEQGRPYIKLSDDYENQPEDKFLSIELTRYIIQDLLQRRNKDVDKKTIKVMNIAINFLGQISDEMAEILYGQMRAMGSIDIMLDKIYHITVKSIEERDALPNKDIVYEGKIFDRVEGLCVHINPDSYNEDEYPYSEIDLTPITEIYELVGGITNDHWVKLSTKEINKKLKKNDK